MRGLKIFAGLCLAFVAVNAYAIQVSVQTSSKEVSALGFTVNGKKHGGAGKSYSKSGLPAGSYTFGVRVNGLMGTDVGCPVGSGAVDLNKDAKVVLNYDGTKCMARVYQR